MGRLKTWITCCLCLMIVLPFLALPAIAQETKPQAEPPLLPFRYARIWNEPVAVYSSPGDPAQMSPVDTLLPPDSWVSIDEEVEQDGRLWYRVADQAYVLADNVQPGTPSAFHGITVTQQLTYPLAFVAAQELNVRARPGLAADNPSLSTLARYDMVNVLGSERVDDAIWHQIGEGQYVHGAYVRVVHPVQRPADVPDDARWIAVDLAQQTLAAYEGDRLVFANVGGQRPASLLHAYRTEPHLDQDPDRRDGRRPGRAGRLLLAARRALDHVLLQRRGPARGLLARPLRLPQQPRLCQPQPAGRKVAVRLGHAAIALPRHALPSTPAKTTLGPGSMSTRRQGESPVPAQIDDCAMHSVLSMDSPSFSPREFLVSCK